VVANPIWTWIVQVFAFYSRVFSKVAVLGEMEATGDSAVSAGVSTVYFLKRIVCNTTGNCAPETW